MKKKRTTSDTPHQKETIVFKGDEDKEPIESALDDFFDFDWDPKKGKETHVSPLHAQICDSLDTPVSFETQRTQYAIDRVKVINISTNVVAINYDDDEEIRWDDTITFELLSPEGRTYAKNHLSCTFWTELDTPLLSRFSVELNDDPTGEWKIRAFSPTCEEELSLSFVNLPHQYDEVFEINNYLVFKPSEIVDPESTPPANYIGIAPKEDESYTIGLCCIGKDKKPASYEYELKIKNSTGITTYYTTGFFTSQPDNENNLLYIMQESVDFDQYEPGDYTVEIWAFGDKIIDAPLHIGKEQTGEYNLYTIQTRPPVGNIKEASESKPGERDAMDALQEMVGLRSLKQSIADHINYVKLLTARKKAGLKATIPPLHMIFTGNPGTGKTTVADFMGEIFHKMGLLEKGNVVCTNRSKLVGKWIGDTEQKTEAAIEAAKGGVLFIDEAYSLYTNDKDGDRRDYGNRVIETLLPKLSDSNFGTIVILAGYPAEMEQLMESNPGLKSRFPFTFHFEDYSPKELLEIAELTIRREGYTLTDEAREALSQLIKAESKKRDRHFGNARFVNRIIQSEILPAMATRLNKSGIYDSPGDNRQALITIERDDIPKHVDEKSLVVTEPFDETAIDEALARLDRMIGLTQVKAAIHNFVTVARLLHRNGKNFFGEIPLKWSFAGNTGTGKSTVAQIMTDLLKAMNILDNGNFTEIKGEQLYNVPDYKVDEVLQEAMKRSQQGLLFIDGDSPKFKNAANTFDSEQLRIKLAEYTSTLPGAHALIIAENRAPRQELVEQLIDNGAPEVDHTLIFEDYTQDELFEILKQMLSDKEFAIDPEAEAVMRRYIKHLAADRRSCYANARTMKIISRTIIQNTYLRLSNMHEAPARATVLPVDVACFDIDGVPPRHTIGFC